MSTSRRSWVRIVTMLLFLHAGLDADAATFVVDSFADSPDITPGDGLCQSGVAGNPCTLRAAVQEANALTGADSITLPTGVFALTIAGADDSAAAGDLDVTDPLAVTGVAGTSLSGVSGEPIWDVLGTRLGLQTLALDGGGSDIGVRTDSTSRLDVKDVELASFSTALDLSGTTNVTRASFHDNVGTTASAIYNRVSASTIVTESDFIEDHCVVLRNEGYFVLNRSRAITAGCASGPPLLTVLYSLGGLELLDTSSIIVTSPLKGGAVFSDTSTTRLRSTTLRSAAGDTLGTVGPADVSVSNSILGECVLAGSIPLTSLGYNVAGASCNLSAPSDTVGVVTFASEDVPVIGSTSIDTGDPDACPLQDRRGFARPEGAACDRGAIEVGSTWGCSNGTDDDGDGLVDLQDPGCTDTLDPSEAHVRPGDYLITNFDRGALTAFDPGTTRLTPVIRLGGLIAPWDVEVDPDGIIYVSDATAPALAEVDLESGSVGFVSGANLLTRPTGIARMTTGNWLVADQTFDRLIEVDPLSGEQSIVFSDPGFGGLDDLLLDPADDSILVSAAGAGLLHRLTDPLGSPSLSTFTTSVVMRPRQLVLDVTGDVILADSIVDLPIRFDPLTSTDTTLVPMAPFTALNGAATEPSGLYLFTDYNSGEVARVDDATDTVTVLNVGREDPGMDHLFAVPSPEELALTLTDTLSVDGGTVGVADVGDTLAFTAVVTNVGSSPADLLSLESGLDPNLTLVAGSLATSQGTIVEGSLASDPRVGVDLGTLAPAASAAVSWEAVVSDPAPARSVSANAWIRREKLVLAESDDPSTAPAPDPNVIGVGDYGVVVQAVQKISETRGELSGPGNPGGVLRQSSYFGGSAEPLGDIDGDGVGDVAVGAYYDDEGGGPGYGAFSILFLDADGTVKDQRKFSATSPDLALVLALAGLSLGPDNFGSGIANLGDLDGAGPSDFALAVSAWYDDTGGTDQGAVYILFMDASPLQVLSVTKIAEGVGGFPAGQLSNFDYFGNGIENIGDVDGDGVPDLAVGAHLDDTIATNSGGVWILFLTQAGTVKASPAPQIIFQPSPAADDYFGLGIAALGLFDGDAVPDLAVSVTRRDTGGLTDAGAVVITTLNSDGTVKSQTEIAPGVGGLPLGLLEDDDRFGRDLETLPDLDGNGTVELLIGANRDDDAGLRAGAAYVLFLTPAGTVDRAVQLAPQPGVLFNELGEEDRFGLAIAPLGDLDADGSPEIAVGALFDNDGASDAGAVYVLYTATPVPEPGMLLGIGWGVAFLAVASRRRARS